MQKQQKQQILVFIIVSFILYVYNAEINIILNRFNAFIDPLSIQTHATRGDLR